MKIDYEIIEGNAIKKPGENFLHQGVSVKTVLQMDSLFSKVVMPKQYNTLIKRVSVIELKEFSSWIQGNELALTTIQNFPTATLQKKLLHQLAMGGAACLGFHPGIQENKELKIFEETINYAKQLNFPILLLNPNSTYWEVIEAVFKVELEGQNQNMGISSQINQELFQYLSINTDINRMIQKVGQIIGKEVLLTDIGLKPLTGSEYPQPSVLKNLLEDIEFKRFINKKDIIKLLINGNMLHIKVSNDKRHMYDVLLAPINQDYYLKSMLLVLGKPNYLLVDKVLKDTAIAIQLEKDDGDELDIELLNLANEHLFINNYPEKARESFKGLGINIDNKVALIVMKVSLDMEDKQNSDDLRYISNLKFRLKKHTEAYLAAGDASVWFKNNLVIFIGKENKEQMFNLVKQLGELTNQFFSFLHFNIGVSSLESGNLYYSYKEAMRAIKKGEEENKKVTTFDEIGFSQVFTGFEDQYYLEKFYKKTLQPILELELERQIELLVTMKTFINSNLNYKETAAYLFVHPNTIRYRIKQISQVYRDENILLDPEKRFTIQFALKLMNF